MQHSQTHAPSYYAATANPYTAFNGLSHDIEADICVIGGGFTGLSVALHAAERGFSVVVLEASRIGWGASGRNGGQMIAGLRKSSTELAQRFGDDTARTLMNNSNIALDLMKSLILKYNIKCDLKSGHLIAAHAPGELSWMKAETATLERLGSPHSFQHYSKQQVEEQVAHDGYYGGLYDPNGGHVHPLNYAIGLAQAAAAAGAQIYENNPVIRLESGTAGDTIKTSMGVVKAKYVVLACDALIDGLQPDIEAHIMPVANYIIATEPLSETEALQLIPNDIAISDTKFVVDYYRLSADRRLLFSGGERYTPRPPQDIVAAVRPHMLRVFPQLKDKKIDFSWGGMVSVTMSRLPHFGRVGRRFFAHGYSGQGVVLTTLAGKILADAIAGTADHFDVYSKIVPPAFPGGKLLRNPLYVAGMLWYALRDRLP